MARPILAEKAHRNAWLTFRVALKPLLAGPGAEDTPAIVVPRAAFLGNGVQLGKLSVRHAKLGRTRQNCG